MKVGAIIQLHKDTNIDEKFQEFSHMDLKSCQLVCWDRSVLHDDQIATQIVQASQQYHIPITAFWCGWEGRKVWDFYEGQLTLGLVPVDYRIHRLNMLLEGIEFAHKINVTNFITHIGYLPENPYDPNYHGVLSACKCLVEKCRTYNMNFLFETGQETPITLKRAIQDLEKELGKGNIGINLDPANLLMYGKANPVDALDIFGEYVKGIHGKDGMYPTDGHTLGIEVPLGQGRVNYPLFISKLKEIKYQGDITIEREISGEEQKRDIILAKQILEQLIG